ncbi:MAG: SRPBCC family protein [Immundisolibacteraceae bacterium]|nr:SRPBCC family protein [Immundisolibacteraceae bacterium]
MDRAKIHEEIVIEECLDEVWRVMANFGDMSPWFPSAEQCSVTGSGVGAVRRLQMPDGGVLFEEQTERVEQDQYTYKIIDGDVPFSDYSSRFAVVAEGDNTRVIWTANFIPAEGAEQSAVEFVSTVYRAGLEGGRVLLEESAKTQLL